MTYDFAWTHRYVEFYRDGYSCDMNDTTAVIRNNQDFCVGKAIAIRTYAMFFVIVCLNQKKQVS
jgi:hypothetical protein